MLGNYSEQLKQSSKPLSAIVNLHTKAMSSLGQHQAAFISGMFGDSARYMSAAGRQKDLKGLMIAQSHYAEALRDRVTTASSHTLATLSEARDELSQLIAGATSPKASTDKADSATPSVKQTAPAATPKSTRAKRSTTKTTQAARKTTKKVTKPVTKNSATKVAE